MLVSERARRLSSPQQTFQGASEQLVDQLVAELNQMQGAAALDLALRMGRLIVERFYAGDVAIWRRHRAKEMSYRRLAARADNDLKVSASTLYRSVALYELTSRLSTEGISALTMTHLRAVLGLPDGTQMVLLENAARLSWSTDRLEKEALTIRASLSVRRGRPAAPPLIRAVRKLVAGWKDIEEVLRSPDPSPLSRDDAEQVYRTVDDLKVRLDRLGRRLVADSHSSTTEGTTPDRS
jgi:hypothetical protein